MVYHRYFASSPSPRARALALLVVITTLVACGSDDSTETKDAATSCKDLCSASGFSSSRVDAQPNEINCFCSGGSGTVTAATCTDGCKSQGKSKSQPFKASGPAAAPGMALDSCQCS